MKNSWLSIFMMSILCISCVSEELKREMNENMKEGQEIFADHDFRKAIAFIEIHKLRYGSYPDSLHQLKFIGAIDSSIFNSVAYVKRDSVYELDLKTRYIPFGGQSAEVIQLDYPDDFWQGLGCVKSNMKKYR